MYQLLELFSKHQLHVAEQIDHIKFNTEFLQESNHYCRFDVHVKKREGSEVQQSVSVIVVTASQFCLVSTCQDNLRVKVYIQLPVAFTSLPGYLTSVSGIPNNG